MMRRAKILRNTLPLLLPFFFLSCNKRVNNDTTPPERTSVPAFGSQNTFEIATWNIEQFPKSNQTVNDVVGIIKDLDIDLFAVQEITSTSAFNSLLDSLPEYDGIVSTQTSPGFALWTGIIYRNSMVAISNQDILFTDDPYNFPRFPYSVYIQANQNNVTFDFTLIVIHLKAYEDQDSENRRRNAIQRMEQYIDDQLQQGGDPDYIIAGDWNDQLDDAVADNVFLPFLNQPQAYTFLTLPFAGSPTEYSYIGGNFESLIDHIMITASIDTAYNVVTQIIKIDQVFTQYETEVSDHRPVAARIPAFQTP